MEMIQVPAARENDFVSLLRGLIERVLVVPFPDIDHRVWMKLQSVIEELLPDNCLLAQAEDDIEQSRLEVLLQVLESGDVPRFHPRHDGAVFPPAVKRDLIASKMNVIVREDSGDLFVELMQEVVGLCLGRVER